MIDPWHGRGLGGVLIERLCRRARERGITRFSAELRADNRAMLELFRHLGDPHVRRESGEIELDVELPLEGSDCLRDALRSAAAGDVALGQHSRGRPGGGSRHARDSPSE